MELISENELHIRSKKLSEKQFWKKFWGLVKKYDNGCWIWMKEGQCQIWYEGKLQSVYKVACILLGIEVPKGSVYHVCHNTSCINPDHLIEKRLSGISTAERFWKYVNKKEEDECWKWEGSVDPFGYGHFYINEKDDYAHRASYFLTYGEIPDRMYVLHMCDNPICVNPKHLFLGTQKDNMQDMLYKGRSGKAVLTYDIVKEIRGRYDNSNMALRELADEYNISYSDMWCIIKNKSWIKKI